MTRIAWLVVAAVGCGNDIGSIPKPDGPALPTRVRLLTDAQYTNAVHDLLGDVRVPELHSPGTTPHQFIHEDVLAIDSGLLVQYRISAEAIAAEVAANPDAPGRDGVTELASRAFRRPLTTEEAEQLLAIYDLGAAEGAPAGFGLVVETVLQAPSFVYRIELGAGVAPAGETVALTPHEIASELGFLLINSLPDEPLWRAANDGTLAQPEVIERHVERLLESPRVRDHLVEVILDWLDVHDVYSVRKDETLFPELTPELRHSMFLETQQFVRDVLWARGGSLDELLTSSETFVDHTLGEHYGLRVVSPTPVRVDGDSHRGGILTHASILTTLATERSESIIQRGMFLRHKFLCLPDPGRPPFAAIAMEANFTANMSESQFAHFRAAHLYCSSCHEGIDPPGRSLHHFDGVGRWREVEPNASPIEAEAKLVIGDQLEQVDGAVELGRVLAASPHVGRCVVDQLTHHALGREVPDRALQRYLHASFERSDHSLVEVFRALATSPAFRTRRGAQ